MNKSVEENGENMKTTKMFIKSALLLGIVLILLFSSGCGFIENRNALDGNSLSILESQQRTKLTTAQKEQIHQYVVDTFGEELEFVRFGSYSNAAGGLRRYAIYKANDREFEVGIAGGRGIDNAGRVRTELEDGTQLYDFFTDDYWFDPAGTANLELNNAMPPILLRRDELALASRLSVENRAQTIEGVIQYSIRSEYFDFFDEHKKDFKAIDREAFIAQNMDKVLVYYRNTIYSRTEAKDFEEDVYQLYSLMKATSAGDLIIDITFMREGRIFGESNSRQGRFTFRSDDNNLFESKEDLRQFYTFE